MEPPSVPGWKLPHSSSNGASEECINGGNLLTAAAMEPLKSALQWKLVHSSNNGAHKECTVVKTPSPPTWHCIRPLQGTSRVTSSHRMTPYEYTSDFSSLGS
jgi:hypothetical protein